MNFTCPNCEMENAYLEIVDDLGARYTCPDCEYKWSDASNKVEEEFDEDRIRKYKKCPNCAKDNYRFLYQCNHCNFIGGFDELKYNGCFQDSSSKVNCPNCGRCDYEIIGQVGEQPHDESEDIEFYIK